MNKKSGLIPILLSAVLTVFLAYSAQAQTVQTNTASQNTNLNQVVLPGGTGYGGTTNNTATDPAGGTVASNPQKYPRTWFNPMNLPGVSGPIYYGGPVRYGKELLDVGILIRFKPVWDPAFSQKFAGRPGKTNVSESIPTPKDARSGTSVTMTLHQPQSPKKLRDFNRSFELVDCYSVDGQDGADSPKLLGMAAEKASKVNADIGIVVNQGANFELSGKDSQQVIGFSPSLMGGGAGSVAGGALGFALGWAQHKAKYLTQPFLVVLLFKSTGVPYDWREEEQKTQPKPVPAVPPSSYNGDNNNHEAGAAQEPANQVHGAKTAKGTKDVPPPKGEKLPYKRPAPSLLIEQQPR
ncbi:MAG: hypothetical protein WC831_03015 [Parcubacteria group bacterium]|jgi:hypothetical protein